MVYGQVRDDAAPDLGGIGIAVQEQDRSALARIDEVNQGNRER